MTEEFHTLRPGLLVSMTTSVQGNVTYHGIDRDVRRDDKAEVTDIHTRKRVADVEEQERAIKQRTKIRGLILSVCVSTAFSNTLLCPNSKEGELRDAIAMARKLTDEFNATATTTNISFYVFTGRIAQDDVETVRAIRAEVRQLVDNMQAGVKALDPKLIRDNANKATEIGKMISPEVGSRLDTAVKAARAAATKLVKAGEQAAKEIDKQALAKLSMARTSFLDLGTDSSSSFQEPKQSGRAIDM
jgi:hypothetical protein